MITVGVDTYITVADATTYILANYPSTDARVAAWGALEDQDKEVYLRRACSALNGLPYHGMTYTALQPLAFPRYVYPDGVMAYRNLIAPLSYIYPELADVPQEIIAAQVEEAFELAAPSADSEKYDAINGPVQSYTIGHLSETYKSVAVEDNVDAALRSGKAKRLVWPFLGGGYDI